MNIGNNISAIRNSKKMTQQQLADKLRIRQQQVSRWEEGIFIPNAKNLKKLSIVLDCSIDDLLKGSDDNGL